MIIAIDGPAGSGKGTIAKLVAQKLHLVTIDTGATYRAIALAAIKNNVSVKDTDKIIELSLNSNIELDEEERTFLNGENVTNEIRSKEVSEIVSIVSKIVDASQI